MPPPPYGSAEHVRDAAELLHDLDRRRLLALDPVRVQRVHEHVRAAPLELARGGERLVEGPADPMTRAPRASRLGELAERDASLRLEHERRDPARAAYAAAEAAVLPVDAHTTADTPRESAREIATVMPRSLKLPVGFAPSHLSQRSTPTADRRGAGRSGVAPRRA